MADPRPPDPDRVSCKAAAVVLGFSPYRVLKEAALGRIKAVAEPGEYPTFDRESVERRAAELGRPVSRARA
jgi:hypothetical protein